MRKFSIILLIAAVVAFVLGDPAIGAFCLVLGAGLFLVSGSPRSDGAAGEEDYGRPARRRPAPRRDYNSRDFDVPGAPAVDAYAYQGTQEAYFYELLTGVFPDYEIRRSVSMHKGGDYAAVSFLMVKDAEPKLAILLGDSNAGKKAPFNNTRYLLEKKGVPVQFYINTFRNKASYVYSRVSDALN